MTRLTMQLAADICGGRLVLVHEGGYSELHVPFCGHAVLEELSGSPVTAPDPLGETIALRQPSPAFESFLSARIAEMDAALPCA
jgi:acetoin utilization deacetylase AcuC-like enzyme